MAYSITTMSADLQGMLHGTTLNQITNLYGVYNRAARQVLLDVDPMETKRIVPLANQIFYQVYDYTAPTDLKGDKIIDIRPQIIRYPRDIYTQSYNQAFDVTKNWTWNNQFTINFNTSLKTLRINSPFLPQGTVINQANEVTGQGTWGVGGGASGIETNNINFIEWGGSLQFDLDAGQATGYIENSTFQSVNLEDQLNQGVEFLYVFMPTGSAITNVELRWGSSAADYYAKSVTTDYSGTSFQNGWNQLGFPWVSATTTGTPDPSDITYLRLTFTYNSTLQTNVLVNSFTSQMGTILDIEYYSKCMFRDGTTGAYKETVTADTDLVNLDTDTYNLLLWQVCVQASQQQQGVNAIQFDGQYFEKKYKETKDRYMALYKSELQKPQSVWYRKPNPSYTQYFGFYRR